MAQVHTNLEILPTVTETQPVFGDALRCRELAVTGDIWRAATVALPPAWPQSQIHRTAVGSMFCKNERSSAHAQC